MDATDGISRLLEAEDDAAEIVKQAREQRVVRMKQAKTEAASFIQNFRGQLQGEFEHRMESDTQTQQFAAKLDENTREDLKEIKNHYNLNKENVIQLILHRVTTVDSTVPPSLVSSLRAIAK